MTRKSKRELERALEDLAGGDDGVTAGRSFAEQEYSEPATTFVHSTMRDVIRLTHDPDIANREEPSRGLLQRVREVYDIDDDRDDAVLAELEVQAAKAEPSNWSRIDVFETSIAAGPALLDTTSRERFGDAIESGKEDLGAQLIVEAVYEWLAERGQDKRTIPQ